ncbi:universal stress protein [Polaribacter litorisediminis]|uniref:universal stress protein n=1 Tax=Polaribacter litorisediminis TaxID=1908341 RepID=UPI001CBBBBE9|nr:universal stress protein [Polaribacter litorisediminis]UAM97564.1 universal stress protein [Polaribacter litorisediminis]
MTKRIVLPTDFSKNAYNAIHYAIELYKTQSCEFFIIHSYYLPLPEFKNEILLSLESTFKKLNEVEEQAEKNMKNLKSQVSFIDDNRNHTLHFLNDFGTFHDVLKRIIEKKEIHLIIMGMRGETDDENAILGSNTLNTIKKFRSSAVLSIPGDIIFKNPKEIVFATNFKIHFKKNEMATLIEISKVTNATIRVLYIQSDKEFSKEQKQNKILLDKILGSTKYTHQRVFHQYLQESNQDFTQSRDGKMIAFVNKKHDSFGSIFSSPMVKELGVSTNMPVLALQDLKN